MYCCACAAAQQHKENMEIGNIVNRSPTELTLPKREKQASSRYVSRQEAHARSHATPSLAPLTGVSKAPRRCTRSYFLPKSPPPPLFTCQAFICGCSGLWDPVSGLYYQPDLLASSPPRPEELHSLPPLQHAHCVTLIYQGESGEKCDRLTVLFACHSEPPPPHRGSVSRTTPQPDPLQLRLLRCQRRAGMNGSPTRAPVMCCSDTEPSSP